MTFIIIYGNLLFSEDVNEILFKDMKSGILQLNALSEGKSVSKQQLDAIMKFMESDKRLSRPYHYVGEFGRDCVISEIANNIKTIKEKKSAYSNICEWYLFIEGKNTILTPAQLVFFNRIIAESKERIEMGE